MEEQKPSAPVTRPQAVLLIGWLTVLACAFWFVWEVTGFISHSPKWLAEDDFVPLTSLITYSLLVAYFIVRPALQFLAMRAGGRREMIGITAIVAFVTSYLVLGPMVHLVIGLGHFVSGTVDPIFTIKGMVIWRYLGGFVLALCLIMKIREVLKSEELVNAFAEAEVLQEQQKLERARLKSGRG